MLTAVCYAQLAILLDVQLSRMEMREYVVSRFDWVRGRKKDLPCAHGSPDGVPLASSNDEPMHARLQG